MKREETALIHVRLPKSVVKAVDHLCVDADIYRNEGIARLLAWAVANYPADGLEATQ